jgi:hypothetical protein
MAITKIDQLEKIKYAEDAEKSLVELNNWVFGISIGIYAILVFKMKDFELDKYSFTELYFKALIVYSMISVLICGATKYHLFIRKSRLERSYAYLKKIIIVNEINKKPDFEEKWRLGFDTWTKEFNKLSLMAKFINLSIVATALLVLFFSVFVCMLIF